MARVMVESEWRERGRQRGLALVGALADLSRVKQTTSDEETVLKFFVLLRTKEIFTIQFRC